MAKGFPTLIQGGMGVGVSDWKLARAVSVEGHLGVVSGTALDVVFARRLQQGDPGGHMRRALETFPIPGVAERVLSRYYIAGGKEDAAPYRTVGTKRDNPSPNLAALLVTANYSEVYLAKEGHDGVVGVNYLEKIQAPTLASIYGAMLGGVDFVLMGAGIPRAIPAILDAFAAGEPAELRLDVKGAERDDVFVSRFDPASFAGGEPPPVRRPRFLAIISSHILATMLARKIAAPVDGFVIEAPTAGGHNAPPRGAVQLNERGEPVYGDRDVPDLAAIRGLGLPFWLAGKYAEPDRVQEALALGATGVQVGTAFAYCEESGFDPAIKRRVLELSKAGRADVYTDPVASPSGFPFKVIDLAGTLSDPEIYEERSRICDLGYLRHAYRREDGSMDWRCPAEPIDDYLRKGGAIEDTVGRKCLCNALVSGIGLGQVRESGVENTIVTSGDDVATVARFLPEGADTYRAADVIRYLLPLG